MTCIFCIFINRKWAKVLLTPLRALPRWWISIQGWSIWETRALQTASCNVFFIPSTLWPIVQIHFTAKFAILKLNLPSNKNYLEQTRIRMRWKIRRDKARGRLSQIRTKRILFMLTVTTINSMDKVCRSFSRTKDTLKDMVPRWGSTVPTIGSTTSSTVWQTRAPSSKRPCRTKTSAVFVCLNRMSKTLLCRRVKEVRAFFLYQWSCTSIRFLINSR